MTPYTPRILKDFDGLRVGQSVGHWWPTNKHIVTGGEIVSVTEDYVVVQTERGYKHNNTFKIYREDLQDECGPQIVVLYDPPRDLVKEAHDDLREAMRTPLLGTKDGDQIYMTSLLPIITAVNDLLFALDQDTK